MLLMKENPVVQSSKYGHLNTLLHVCILKLILFIYIAANTESRHTRKKTTSKWLSCECKLSLVTMANNVYYFSRKSLAELAMPTINLILVTEDTS